MRLRIEKVDKIMNRLKQFFQTALTYLAGSILSKLVTFFLIPLYTNQLSTNEYGEYDVTITIITLLVSVAFFQIWDGMFRMSFDESKTEDKYQIIGICLKGYGLGIVLFSVLYYLISKFAITQQGILPYIFGIVFGAQYMYSFAARVFLKNKLFVLSGAISTLTIALINIVLILQFHVGIQSLYYAQIAGCVIQILIIETQLHLIPNTIMTKTNPTKLKNILKFSFPLCIATVSYWLLSGYTKIIINRVCGSEENGLFAIASSIANIAVIAVNVFQFAWNETAYLMANDENRVAMYRKCLDLLFCTVWVCCAAFCSIISIIFPYYVGHAYQNSSVVIPYLMVGVSANAIAGFLGTLFMTEQKTRSIMVSTLVASGVNIVFSKFVTQAYGLVGAVLVLSASFVILMVIRLLQIKKKLKISFSPFIFLSIFPAVLGVILYTLQFGIIVNIVFLFSLVVGYIYIMKKIIGISFIDLILKKGKQ